MGLERPSTDPSRCDITCAKWVTCWNMPRLGVICTNIFIVCGEPHKDHTLGVTLRLLMGLAPCWSTQLAEANWFEVAPSLRCFAVHLVAPHLARDVVS